MKRAKHLILNITAAFILAAIPATFVTGMAYAAPRHHAPAPSPAPAAASSCPTGQSAKAQVLQGLGATGSDCSDKQVNSLFATAVNIISILIGVLSVIVIMVAAIKYLTSSGNENKVSNAKGTLTYAIIGLAVAGVAQLLVHFVLYQTTHLGT